MAARADHAGQGRRSVFWQVEIARDQETGTALKDDLFDAISVAFDDTGHTRVERRLFRQRAKTGANLFSDRSQVSFSIGFGLQRGFALQRILLDGAHTLHEILLHHARETVERWQRGICRETGCLFFSRSQRLG
jgi:hypothetical protein